MSQSKEIEKWVLLGTGGTIAGTADSAMDHTGYESAQLSVQELIRSLPGLAEVLQDRPLEVEQVAQLDSKDMDHATWLLLARRCAYWLEQAEVKGVVITHGTDTLEETAWFLQQVLQPVKPIVLTCAMRPSTALGGDGPQNLIDALVVASDPMSRGVIAVCAGVIHAARRVQKVHPYRLDAFGSGDAGPLGWVEAHQVRWAVNPEAAEMASARAQAVLDRLLPDVKDWPRVEVVWSHAGAGRALVDAVVASGVDGLVVACTGNGTVHHQLAAALQDARARGVAVCLSTRCPLGQVVNRTDGLFPDTEGLSVVKARISVMLQLMEGQTSRSG
ncbi:MAG: asparaginase [Rhodoferax sp.]